MVVAAVRAWVERGEVLPRAAAGGRGRSSVILDSRCERASIALLGLGLPGRRVVGVQLLGLLQLLLLPLVLVTSARRLLLPMLIAALLLLLLVAAPLHATGATAPLPRCRSRRSMAGCV